MADRKDDDKGRWTAYGISIGMLFGVAIATVTGEWYWLAIGLGVGAAFGPALAGAQGSRKQPGSGADPTSGADTDTDPRS